ncbi:MAG TPA: DsbA family oxidoreductase [Acidimicrobiales bacterium]|nr:DsbA family oxidoreductase [Acidimicrobiales bacterium]
MLVEIWSDVVCPWCYIGKRQFEAALASFPHKDEVSVEWRSFELDPSAPARRQLSTHQQLAKKYGMTEEQARAATERVSGVATEVGLDFQWDVAKSGNTFDAHRLIHLAATHGLGDVAKEALMAAYFTHGAAIGERDALEQVGKEIGLDADEVATALDDGAFADEVRADEKLAGELGISAVPFFVIDRAIGVPGAQTPDVLLSALEQGWTQAHPLTIVSGPTESTDVSDSGDACSDGSCAV